MLKKILIQLLLSGSILSLVHNVFIPFVRMQNKLQLNITRALSVDPPEVTHWIHNETYYFLFLYILCISIAFAYTRLSKYLNIFKSQTDAFLYYSILIIIVSLYHTKEQIFVTEKTFLKEKAFFYIIFIIISLILYFKKSDIFNRLIINCKHHINTNYYSYIFILILISSIQRIIALSLDNNILVEGDDPNTFYQQALILYNNVINPSTGFSPGMSFYLFGVFKLFGISQIIPKLLMILIGAIGLLSLSLFTKSFFNSKLLSIFVILFYISSSHYVSFSNQFWNENLFNPLLSIFLYLSWHLTLIDKKFYLSIYLLSLSIIMLSLTLLRSWFPALAFIWLIFLFYKIFYYQTNISNKILQFLIVIFLYLFSLFSYNYHLSNNNTGVVTSNSAINLLIGNNPYSQGTYTRHWVTFTRDYKIDVTKNDYMKKVIEINLENPMLIASNISKKTLLWFFSAGGPRPISPYYQHPLLIPQYFYRITVFFLLLFGIRTLYKYKKGLIIVFMYFTIFSIHMVYFADYRFTLTAMPFQAIIVSFGFLRLLNLSYRNSDARPPNREYPLR